MVHLSYIFLACNALMPVLTSASSHTRMQLRGGGLSPDALQSGDEACTDLINKGSFFSVNIEVGTPLEGTGPQMFEVVADTGSDAVIVTSCVCVANGYCPKDSTCFQGTNHSSTFGVMKETVHNSTRKAPLGVSMAFGSGMVSSIIATDKVRLAGVNANMPNGVLLMVDRRLLAVGGDFEGILGLGPPEVKHESLQNRKEGKVHKTPKDGDQDYVPQLWMRAAGVSRYSLCFADSGKPGAFRLNVGEFEKPLPTIGSFHWGLGLFGISVGSEEAPAFLCSPDTMKKGQKSPCGGIPDSGTTLLMGPAKHIEKIFSELCDSWDRCKLAREGDMSNETKSHAFQKLLYTCGDWEDKESGGINEVPSIFLNVGGDGITQKIELTAWSWVVETKQEELEHHRKYLFGVVPVDVPENTGKYRKVCAPSMSTTEYNTKDNGLVWILGHPLFYQYNVGYSLDQRVDSKTKGSISFSSDGCKNCDDPDAVGAEGPMLLSSNQELSERHYRPTRLLHPYKPRMPSIDMTLPL